MHNKKHSKISGTGSFLPHKIVTNSDLFEIVKDSFDHERARKTLKHISGYEQFSPHDIFTRWVPNGTGILERRWYSDDFTDDPLSKGDVESMGYAAAVQAIQASRLTPTDIDYIIFATFTEHGKISNPACTLSGMLNIHCGGIPINTACSGFVDGLIDAHYRIISGDFKNILVVGSEALTKVTNIKDVPTAILFGDGACAAVVTASDEEGIIKPYCANSYSADQITLLASYANESYKIAMNGGAGVLRRAAQAMKSVTDHVLQKASLSVKDLTYILPHQANGRIIETYKEILEVDNEKMINVIANIGNVSCASIGIALDKLFRRQIPGKALSPGDLLSLSVVGGGYTKAGLLYRV